MPLAMVVFDPVDRDADGIPNSIDSCPGAANIDSQRALSAGDDSGEIDAGFDQVLREVKAASDDVVWIDIRSCEPVPLLSGR